MSDFSPARQELAELAQRIRAALQASRADRCNALHHDLEVGEALIEAQNHVTTGWKHWLGENCSLSVRTAMLYMQLARHRAEIEAEIERVGEVEPSGSGPARHQEKAAGTGVDRAAEAGGRSYRHKQGDRRRTD